MSNFTRFQTLETVLIIGTFICYNKSCSKTPKALHFKSSDVYKAESQVLERMTFKLMSVIHCQAKVSDYLKTIFKFSFTNNIMMNSHWKCRISIVIKHHLGLLVISFELALHVMTVWIYNCQWHLSFSTTNASVLWFGTHACNDISFADGLSGRHQKHVMFMQPLIDFEQRKWISLLAKIWGLHFRGKWEKSVSCGLDLQTGIKWDS